jgi:nucleoside phosphorylase/tetratricopeptide (TPR) repeat protein
VDIEEARGRVDFGILTIREDEFRAVLRRFPVKLGDGLVSGLRMYNLRTLDLNDGSAYTVAVLRCTEQGNGEALAATRDLIEDLAPRWILVVGIAGAAPAHELTLGDVVISTRIIDFSVEALLKDGSFEHAVTGGPVHHQASVLAANLPAVEEALGAWNAPESIVAPRPPVDLAPGNFYGDEDWQKKVRRSLQHHFGGVPRAPRFTAGALAVSDRLVKDAERMQAWQKAARQFLAVEMESGGAHRATDPRSVPFLAIRGISDVVGFERDPAWTEYACHSAAAFARAFLLTKPIPPETGGTPARVPERAKPPTDLPPTAALPRKPQRFFGRDAVAEQVTAAVLRAPTPAIVLLGPGGIGKSTLTLEVLQREEVAARFGARRWFVRLDAAPTAEAAVGLVMAALGLTPHGRPLAEVRAFLAGAPGVLALDNLETPWEGDREPTDAMLGELAGISGVVLVASVRGAERPAGVAWGETVVVEPLAEKPAVHLFCDIWRGRRDDPALAGLLARLEGVPLAITLLAHVAEGASLSGVVQEWEAKHTALLRKEGTKEGRETSWAASMELSVGSPRMTGEARRLLALLGRLPDGVAFGDVEALLPGKGNEAKRKLVQVGLAYEEEERLRVLAPVRAYARETVAPEEEDLGRAMEHYGRLARELGPSVGWAGGAEASARLEPETANLDAMIRQGLKGNAKGRWVDMAVALTNFARFSGRALPSPLVEAQEVAHKEGDVLRDAQCTDSIGMIACDRWQLVKAQSQYARALSLFCQVGSVEGQAGCLEGQGDVAFRGANYTEAARWYERALPLYHGGHDIRGEANCIWSLGLIALEHGDLEEAARRCEEALPLFQKARALRGEVNCIKSLGQIEAARGRYSEAVVHYEMALPLYRSFGHLGGVANCIYGLGYVALKRSDPTTAKEHFLAALALYTRIPDPYSMGETHLRLARLATDPAEKQHHLATARALWTQIDRPDLIARYLDVP